MTDDTRKGTRHRPGAGVFTSGPGDQAGCLLTDGLIPAEALGRHCAECGEGITAVLPSLPPGPGPVTAEWRHLDGYAHCAFMREGHRVTGIAEETARPCWKDGCLSNAEHEAAREHG